ncbi:unnamed protein product [Owenia fusiformis]|uniref:Uncharacterized protein n=1 Tax=Owenia fusiformis TaxID=6347 RepID=A0A8J1XII3_OWEFU|nr:unnamed protein product [Owenia fusiformis]
MDVQLFYLLLSTALLWLTPSCYGRIRRPPPTPPPAIKEWTVEDYPNPQRQVYNCGRNGITSWVCDPNNLITHNEANYLDDMINFFMKKTKCACPKKCKRKNKGYHIAIALMNKMKPYSDFESFDDKLKHAAYFSHQLESMLWKYGMCQEDIVILYSKEDNVIYTMPGNNSRKILDGNMITEVTMESRVYFEPGKNITKGLETMIKGYRAAINGEYGRNRRTSSRTKDRLAASAQQSSNDVPSFKPALYATLLLGVFTALWTLSP